MAFQVSNWFPSPTREVADRPTLIGYGTTERQSGTCPPSLPLLDTNTKNPKILSAAAPPSPLPPPPCVPRRPGTPSNHRHAPPLLVRRRHRLSIPNAWQLSVVDAVLPPLQHRRHQLWQLSLCHRHGPPPPAATRRRPSNHQKRPTRLHRWISANSQQHASRPRSWRPSRSGGRSFGWTSPNLDATAQHSRARPDGPDPVCAGECLGESILTTSQLPPHTVPPPGRFATRRVHDNNGRYLCASQKSEHRFSIARPVLPHDTSFPSKLTGT